jgi:hypothetical protein
MKTQRKTAKPDKVIFDAAEVAPRLEGLKAAAEPNARWWAPALRFEFNSGRKGAGGTQWFSLYYTDSNGLTGPLVLRINGERHTGQIMPSTAEGVAELMMSLKNPQYKIEERGTKKPAIQIQRWNKRVPTEDDGVTVAKGPDGQPLLPDDSARSTYFRVAVLVNEAFTEEANARIDRGVRLISAIAPAKRANKDVTAQQVCEQFKAADGDWGPGDILYGQDIHKNLDKVFPNAYAPFLRGALVATATKVFDLVQERISDKALRNRNAKLPNPLTRISLNFGDKAGGPAVYDGSQPYTDNAGKRQFETFKVNGKPVDAANVHKAILPRSGIDAIVNMDCVCLSSVGVSVPVSAVVVIVTPPVSRDLGLDDLMAGMPDEGFGSAVQSAQALPEVGSGVVPARDALPGFDQSAVDAVTGELAAVSMRTDKQ